MNATQCTHCESANVRTTDDDGDPCSPWCDGCGHRPSPSYQAELRGKLREALSLARAASDWGMVEDIKELLGEA